MSTDLIDVILENSSFILLFGIVIGTLISLLVYLISLLNIRSD